MNTAQPGKQAKVRGAALSRTASFPLLFAAAMAAAACGAPGEPTPPGSAVPVPVTDLSARQMGDAAQLSFTLPAKTVAGDRLAEPPAIELLRGDVRADGVPDARSFRVVQTIPGALVTTSLKEDRVEVTDPIPPEEIRARPGAAVAYTVRTRASKKHASANSNSVVIRLFPAAERVASVRTEVTEKAIRLSWTAPARTSGGDSLPGPPAYRVYRGEIEPDSAEQTAKDLAKAKWRSRLALLGQGDTPEYQDAGFEFGKTYAYVVRSVVSTAGEPVESSDSAATVVTPVDTFPPAQPQGVVATVLAGTNEVGPWVELSWSINSETDLAGYRVYRSEQEGTRGASITPELLLTPALRDTSVQPGHRYCYTITAVDRAGNESVPSQPVAVNVAQP